MPKLPDRLSQRSSTREASPRPRDALDALLLRSLQQAAFFGDDDARIQLAKRLIADALEDKAARLKTAPDAVEVQVPAPLPSDSPAAPPKLARRPSRGYKADNDAADDAIARRLIAEGKINPNPRTGGPTPWAQCNKHHVEIPGSAGPDTKRLRLIRAVRRVTLTH